MLTLAEVFDLIPQQRPFRFVDRLIEVDEQHAIGEYTYRPDEVFFSGHFPGYPVTPAAILIETMAQIAHSLLIYQLGLEMNADEIRKLGGAGTEINVELARIVLPGTTVRATAQKIFWRGHKLKSRVDLKLADGATVSHGTISGMASASKAARAYPATEAGR
jgi:3-hydroxyacyl-[acyl-carrier-protein] dehydratase